MPRPEIPFPSFFFFPGQENFLFSFTESKKEQNPQPDLLTNLPHLFPPLGSLGNHSFSLFSSKPDAKLADEFSEAQHSPSFFSFFPSAGSEQSPFSSPPFFSYSPRVKRREVRAALVADVFPPPFPPSPLQISRLDKTLPPPPLFGPEHAYRHDEFDDCYQIPDNGSLVLSLLSPRLLPLPLPPLFFPPYRSVTAAVKSASNTSFPPPPSPLSMQGIRVALPSPPPLEHNVLFVFFFLPSFGLGDPYSFFLSPRFTGSIQDDGEQRAGR